MPDQRIQVPPNCELTLGMTCIDKSEPGRTVWRMSADERFANPAGIIQGGFLSAMADSAMGAAAVTFAVASGRKVFSSNVEMKTSFLAPTRVGARKLVFISTLDENTLRPEATANVTAAAPIAESAMALRNPPWMMPAGLANRSSADIRQTVRPGSDLSIQVIPRVNSQLGGTWIR